MSRGQGGGCSLPAPSLRPACSLGCGRSRSDSRPVPLTGPGESWEQHGARSSLRAGHSALPGVTAVTLPREPVLGKDMGKVCLSPSTPSFSRPALRECTVSALLPCTRGAHPPDSHLGTPSQAFPSAHAADRPTPSSCIKSPISLEPVGCPAEVPELPPCCMGQGPRVPRRHGQGVLGPDGGGAPIGNCPPVPSKCLVTFGDKFWVVIVPFWFPSSFCLKKAFLYS